MVPVPPAGLGGTASGPMSAASSMGSSRSRVRGQSLARTRGSGHGANAAGRAAGRAGRPRVEGVEPSGGDARRVTGGLGVVIGSDEHPSGSAPQRRGS
jgi:hypothetical protein